MPECELVHQSAGRTTKDPKLAARLQPTTSAQFVALLAARRICTDSTGDEGMRKASTELLEQGTQTSSPAPDLIPAETKKSTEDSHCDWYNKRGHFTSDKPRLKLRRSRRQDTPFVNQLNTTSRLLNTRPFYGWGPLVSIT